MSAYIALIHKEASSDYGVSFPDFPGCVTAGSTLEEARANPVEALAFHIEAMIEDGEAIPEPSELTEVMRDRENHDAVAVMVEVPARQSKVVRVNITIHEDVLRQIDEIAEAGGFTRSGFISRTAVRAIAEGWRPDHVVIRASKRVDPVKKARRLRVTKKRKLHSKRARA